MRITSIPHNIPAVYKKMRQGNQSFKAEIEPTFNCSHIEYKHNTGVDDIERALANELPNIHVTLIKDIDVKNYYSFDQGYEGYVFRVKFKDGLKAREEILEEQAKYQTLPDILLDAYKQYNPVLVNRIGKGYVEFKMYHYKDREFIDEFANRAATKIRAIAKNLPEILLTDKIKVGKDGTVYACSMFNERRAKTGDKNPLNDATHYEYKIPYQSVPRKTDYIPMW